MQSRDAPPSVPFLLPKIHHHHLIKEPAMLTTYEAQFLTVENKTRTWVIHSQTQEDAILAAETMSEWEHGTLIRVFKELVW
jgi:hypothetical protein